MLQAISRLFWLCALVVGTSLLGLIGSSRAQLAPGGYTAALNTPTAGVITLSTLDFSLANNNPEMIRANPGVGHFGSAVLGFGALPGLELVSRLAYEGDMQCSQFATDCKSTLRDVSINGKYLLPVEGPLNSRVALGFTDYGGAATHFRQTYGVGSARWNYIEGSVGYASVTSPSSLLHGIFKSGTLHLSERLMIKVEDDGRHRRAGAAWKYPLSPTVMLAGTLSRLTSGPAELQRHQISLGLQWFLDADQVKDAQVLSRPAVPMSRHMDTSSEPISPKYRKAELIQPTHTPEVVPQRLPSEVIADQLASHGFGHIHVGILPEQMIKIRVEPVGWRKSRSHAIGAALGAWLRTPGSEIERLELTLTYLQQPVLTINTTRACAQAFLNGESQCNGQAAIQFHPSTRRGWRDAEGVTDSHSTQFHPELEIGLATAYTVGTEYGLVDYSLGLDVGWQVPLARGFLWQGNAVSPVTHSDDFRPPSGYWQASRIQSGLQSSLFSYQTPLAPQLWGQFSTGQIDTHSRGQQLNLTWQDISTRWRVTGIQGHYRQDDQTLMRKPQLLSTRYSVLPGLWSLDVTVGQFYSGDRGKRLMSDHWFGDHRLTFYVRETASADGVAMPRTRFAGFEFTIPLGPKQSHMIGPVSIRGRDQFPIGLSTKIGTDNNITSGYGLVPMLRHGLNDIMDHDRVGGYDLDSQQHRIRSVMREVVNHK